jgi:hypothetical protein
LALTAFDKCRNGVIMLKTYAGGCHCGAIRFEADIDLAAGTWKCNCTICAKNRLWSFEVGPQAMRLLAGAEYLQDYSFRDHVAHHYFCKRCGIHPFELIDLPAENRQYYNVNVNCVEALDMDAVMAAPIRYIDGLNDRSDRVPTDIRHL